jgi:glycosyltransferase involved in cell wall biosynthesis
VSTWCDALIRDLGDVEMHVLAIAASALRRWPEPGNVTTTRIPVDPPDARIERTTPEAVEEHFAPALCRVLDAVAAPGTALETTPALHELWHFAQTHHWPTAWRSEATWRMFAAHESAETTVGDLVTALRELQAVLAPLAAPLPRTDVAHATSASAAILPCAVSAHAWGTPVVLTDHPSPLARRRLRGRTPYVLDFLGRVDAYFAELAYALARTVVPVTHGVEAGAFAHGPKPERLRGTPTVVAPMRLTRDSDVETTIRAAATVRAAVPAVRFLIHGATDVDEGTTARCRALIAELGLEETVSLPGVHRSPAELYLDGDLTVAEGGAPEVAVESAAAGRPVVVAPPGDPAALAKAITALLQDDVRRVALGRHGRERLDQRRSEGDVYREVYAEVTR